MGPIYYIIKIELTVAPIIMIVEITILRSYIDRYIDRWTISSIDPKYLNSIYFDILYIHKYYNILLNKELIIL